MESRRGSMELLFGLIATSLANECPQRSETLSEAKQMLLEGNLTESKEKADLIEQSFTCGDRVTRTDFGKFMLLKGSHFYFDKRMQKSTEYFRMAQQLNVWDSLYGPQLHQYYVEASKGEVDSVQLTVEIPRTYSLFIDGSPMGSPVQVEVNHHLIQVTDKKNQLYYSKYAYIQSDHHISISEPPGRKKSLLYISTTTSVFSISSAILARRQNKDMVNSGTIEELNKQFQQQKIFTAIAWSMFGLSVTSGGFYFFW